MDDQIKQFFNLIKDIDLKLDVPEWIIGGLQNKGKSSILEALLGLQFNFSTTGMATLVPLKFRIYHNSKKVKPFWNLEYRGYKKMFENVRGDTSIIRNKLKEINLTMAQIILNNDKIDDLLGHAVYLELHWSEVSNLFFIDMPGIQINAADDKVKIKHFIDQLYAKTIKDYPKAMLLVVERSNADFNNLGGLNHIRKLLTDEQEMSIIINRMDEINNNSEGQKTTQVALDGLANDNHVKHVFLTSVPGTSKCNDFIQQIKEKNELCNDICRDAGFKCGNKLELPTGTGIIFDMMKTESASKIKSNIPNIIVQLDSAIISHREELNNIEELMGQSELVNGNFSRIDQVFTRNFRNLWYGRINDDAFVRYNVNDEFVTGFRRDGEKFSYQNCPVWQNNNVKKVLMQYTTYNIKLNGSAMIRRLIDEFRCSVYYSRLPIDSGNPAITEKFISDLINIHQRIIARAAGNPSWLDTINEMLEKIVRDVFDPDIKVISNILTRILQSWLDDVFDITWTDLLGPNNTGKPFIKKSFISRMESCINDIVNNLFKKTREYLKNIVSTSIRTNDILWSNNINDIEMARLLGANLRSNLILDSEFSQNLDVTDPKTQRKVIDICRVYFSNIKRCIFETFPTIFNIEIREPLLADLSREIDTWHKRLQEQIGSNENIKVKVNCETKIKSMQKIISELNNLFVN